MATEKDLVNAVRDSLEAGGELGRIKAEMRGEVMKLLEGSSASRRIKRPESPRNVIILNELIREYLDWMGYKYTLNVFISECEVEKQPLDRTFLAEDLGVKETDTTKKLPLFVNLVETFRSSKKLSQED